MKAYWLMLAVSYDTLAQRERWMTAIAVLGGLALTVVVLFIDPATERLSLTEQALSNQKLQLTNLRAQTLALQSQGQDPEHAARSELDGLKRQLAELDTRLASVSDTLVPPQKIPSLLENLIGQSSGLRLLELRTLPVTSVVEKKTVAVNGENAKINAAQGVSNSLFKHGVEIRLEGSYQNLAAYLARLEQAPAKLLWSSASLSAEQYPKLELTLRVFTLSLDRTWLAI